MKRIHPDTLSSQSYKMEAQLDHSELLSFVREALSKKTAAAIIYKLLNLLLAGSLAALLVYALVQGAEYFLAAMAYTLLGMGGAMLLIPLHEALHALAYRILGAENITFDIKLKKFYFSTLAHGFVINRREFMIMALLPFVVITTFCLFALTWVSGPWSYFLASVLLIHTACCSGDFGLLSYVSGLRGEVVTYDDVGQKLTFFFVRDTVEERTKSSYPSESQGI
ncbi:MAG: DUF3267 domain-containing protein [Cyclobacteriaceae bacterium]